VADRDERRTPSEERRARPPAPRFPETLRRKLAFPDIKGGKPKDVITFAVGLGFALRDLDMDRLRADEENFLAQPAYFFPQLPIGGTVKFSMGCREDGLAKKAGWRVAGLTDTV